MSLTTSSLIVARIKPVRTEWVQAFGGTAVNACEEVKAAPTAPASHYITKVLVCFDGTGTINIGAGESSSDCATVLFGPVPFAATTPPCSYEFINPVRVAQPTTNSLSITVDASVFTGNLSGIIEGFTV